MADTKITDAIKAIRDTNDIPAMNLLRDLGQAAALSKVIADRDHYPQYDNKGNRRTIEPELVYLRRLAESKINDINDADTVLQMLPDIELASQILISSILSPKDMMSTELSFIPPETICPPNIAGSIIRIIKDHFTINYKIESKLSRILKDILYETGSYPICVIPENAIDEIINNNSRFSQESFNSVFGEIKEDVSLLKPKGILGSSQYKSKDGRMSFEDYKRQELNRNHTKLIYSLESINEAIPTLEVTKEEIKGFENNSYIQVTDNYEILSVPKLIKRMREQTITDMVYSKEDDNISDRLLDDLLFRRMYYNTNTLVRVKSNDQGYRKSIGEPLVMHLPSESVIPVFVPGNPREHIGYFVLLDDNGNPISKDTSLDYYREMGLASQRNKQCLSSFLLDKSKDIFQGRDNASIRSRYDYAVRAYGDIIEHDLVQRLRNGIYGKNVKVGGNTEVYRIMFSRSLSQQYTQVLFIPMELMTYMAFRFDENGMGESLLDKMKIPNSLAIALMLANTRAAIMNSIPRTKVNVKLDEDDPDVESRREQIINEFLLQRSSGGQNGLPIGTMNPVDINHWASMANIEFQFTGAKDLPDMEIDISEFSSAIPKPDTELEEELRKRRIMGQGMSPETVDASQGANFATSVVQESLLFARRAMHYQEMFVPLITDHIRKVALASPSLLDSIAEILYNNFEEVIQYLLPDRKDYQVSDKDKEVIVRKATTAFVKQIELTLPKPDGLATNKKKEEFNTYIEAMDAAIDFYISNEIMPTEIMGELAGNADAIKALVKAHFARKWMVENDFMTELNDLVTLDEDDKPIFNVYEMAADYASAITKSIGKLMDKARPMKETSDIYVDQHNVEEAEGYDSDTSSDNNSDTMDEDDGFTDTDFGIDEDMGMDDSSDSTDDSQTDDSQDESMDDGPTDNF